MTALESRGEGLESLMIHFGMETCADKEMIMRDLYRLQYDQINKKNIKTGMSL